MPPRKKTEDIISFKVDAELLARLRQMPNRSEFIRLALQQALDHVCPLCLGHGYLTAHQKDQWQRIAAQHTVAECPDCHEVHLICETPGEAP